MTIPLYCINLARSRDRRLHMEEQFSAVGWHARFVRAVDAREDIRPEHLVTQNVLASDAEGLLGPITAAEVACFLSHERVWRAVVRDRQPLAVVCEDDIRFRKPFLCWDSFSQALPDEADIIYLHYMNRSGNAGALTDPAFRPEVASPHARFGPHALYQAWSCGGCQSYCVTLAGAMKLLRLARPIRHPVDGFLARTSAVGLLGTFAVSPMPVVLAELAKRSTIRDDG